MNKIWLYSILACAGLALAATDAHATGAASKTAPQTCDPDYWNSMSSRAWMEAQREITQNKNLIFKPDSVMEYVCFDAFMQHAAKHIGDIFTHTKYFNQQEIIKRNDQNYSLEHTLTKAVTNSYKTYIQSNFGHKFLGERAAHMGGSVMADRTLGDASNMRSYECAVMSNIWNAARCENLIHNEKFENDNFYPFDDLKAQNQQVKVTGYRNRQQDMRQYPPACNIPANGNYTWKEAVPRAANEGDKLYKFAEPLKKTYDDIRPKLEPGKCSSNNKAILTGVTVVTDAASKQGYADGICSNPGCSFKKDGTCAAN